MTQRDIEIGRLIDDGHAAAAFATDRSYGRRRPFAAALRLVRTARSKTRLDGRTAETRFIDALRSGSPSAKLFLAELYERQGRYDFALGIVRQAAQQGYSPAHYRIGRYYAAGRGVPQSREAARTCMEKAAARGHLFARGDVAWRRVRGEYGFAGIGPGLVDLAIVAVDIISEARRHPGSRLLAR